MERLSFLKQENLFSLVIFPVRDRKKLMYLFIWIILWTGCGLIFISYLINYSRGPYYAQLEYEQIQKVIKEPAAKEKAIAAVKDKLEKNQSQRMVLIITLIFWGYYEFKIGRAYLYRKHGFEKIWIKDGLLFYRKEVIGKGKTKSFELNFIKDVKAIEYNQHDFFQNMNRSFWNISGESIEFSYHSKTMRFGIQLSQQESAKVAKELNRYIKNIS